MIYVYNDTKFIHILFKLIGILSIQDRITDLPSRAPFEGIEQVAQLSPELEQLIQSQTAIELNSITDAQIDLEIEKLIGERLL